MGFIEPNTNPEKSALPLCVTDVYTAYRPIKSIRLTRLLRRRYGAWMDGEVVYRGWRFRFLKALGSELRIQPCHATITAVNEQRRMRDRLVVLIGSIGPLGYLPASGTVTVALVGMPLFWLLSSWPEYVHIGLTIVLVVAAIGLHGMGDRILGEKDSRKLVWDELAGFLVAVTFVPFTWSLAVLALIIERFIDIVKFPPARWVERHWPGGWGVVGDDLVAGLYTCAILHLIVWIGPGWVGVPA